LLNRVRVKYIGRVDRYTINLECYNYYLKIQVKFTWTLYKNHIKKKKKW